MERESIVKEVLDVIRYKEKCSFVLPTGFGKTRLALTNAEEESRKNICVVVPKKKITESWLKENVDRKIKIKFITYVSLPKLKVDAFDKIYFDECHSVTDTILDKLSEIERKGIPYVGFTGTYPKDKDKVKIMRRYFPLVYKKLADETIRLGLQNDYRIYIHLISLSSERNIERKTKSGKKFFQSEQNMLKYYNTLVEESNGEEQRKKASILRMSAMKSFKSKTEYVKTILPKIKEKTIVFAPTIKSAKEISKNCVHSKMNEYKAKKNLEDFNDGKLKVISTVEQISEGITVDDLKSIIVMHSYSNNKSLMQKLGRLLRLDTGEIAKMHVLCYKNTVDERWVYNALSDIDNSKIKLFDGDKLLKRK